MFVRAWRAEFDVADEEGRTVTGIAVPFNSPTTIFENGQLFEETWKRGSTKESIAKRGDRIRLLGFHDQRAMPLGRPVMLDDRADGLYIEARISDTTDGNDALTLVKDGVLDGFSVGFSVPAGGDRWGTVDGMLHRTVTKADIHEVSLVNFPAFDDARVASVRAAEVVATDGTENTSEVDVTFGDVREVQPPLVVARLQLLRAELIGRQHI